MPVSVCLATITFIKAITGSRVLREERVIAAARAGVTAAGAVRGGGGGSIGSIRT
ncbi:hypothetical protein DPMN_102593 [Dreissena polymorpha]|uniref:Uncharacterized protein n=1 Tax=Dreissena polymorpha TaxID=45954 RepID=A0A9D4RB07_DREPO|nr:hypothetical protein DPMN_102593 [Dreissena polymorpha]